MARELESERGVPSEPPTELIPFLFGAVNRAILVVRTICHLRSERKSFAVAGTENSTRDLTGEALRGETGFASVFGPQNEGHKFTRKCNLTLDTSMAKPTRKPLLRMVEREEYLECLGTSVERPV